MRIRYKFMNLILIILFAAALCGCSISGGSNANVRNLLEKCTKSFAALKSYDAQIIMDTDIRLNGKRIAERCTVEENSFLSPFYTRITTNTGERKPLEENRVIGEKDVSYLKVQDEQYQLYLSKEEGWQYISVNEIGSAFCATMKPTQLEFFMRLTNNAKVIGTESINGYECYKIQGTIDGQNISLILENFKGGFVGEGNRALIEYFSQNGTAGSKADDIEVTYWISQKEGFDVKILIDATEAVQSVLETGDDNEKVTVEIQMSHFNEATAFTLPEK